MSDNNADKLRIEELRKLINHHNELYYNEDKPEIDDYTYDMLMMSLKDLETKHPELITPDSPTQKIGGSAQSSFEKITHKIQMNSLRDVFDFDEVKTFVNKIKAVYPDACFSVEPKIDGLSVSLEYHNGKLIIGSTRGDGFVGEDVTANICKIKTVLKKLPIDISLLEVRGECYMPKTSFAELIAEQTANDKPLAKNARNAAAGALRQKDAKITEKRKLDILFFNVQQAPDPNYKFMTDSHIAALDYLHDIGFNTVPHTIASDYQQIIDAINNIGTSRDTLSYDIDGVVIKIDSLSQREELGANAKTPNWAIAYKFPPEEKQTVLHTIRLQIGRTGAITPVAIFNPIQLAGTTVTKATLCNQKFIADRGIDIGDVITVRKAGDIIPEVLRVAEKHSLNNYYKLPSDCPECHTALIRTSDDGALRCPNPDCPEKLTRQIMHFVSKQAMNIDGLGESTIRQLLDNKLIKSPADLYKLTESDLLRLDGFEKKSASNLIIAIELSKKSSLDHVINALGIKNIGYTASKLLASRFKTMSNLISAKYEDILAIDTFGEISAHDVCDAFDPFSKTGNKITGLVLDLMSHNVNMADAQTSVPTTLKLLNKTFVITGTLPSMSREKASVLIESNGGKISGSVSKKTNYLLAGEKAGSKLDKAQALNIQIISEQDLKAMLN